MGVEGPCGYFGVDSEPFRVNAILESGSLQFFFFRFFFLFLFSLIIFVRKADPGKESGRVETGGADSDKCGDPN